MHRTNFFKQTKKKNKYNSIFVEYNGNLYPSIKEAKYAEDLDWRMKAGEIIKWERQISLSLKVNGMLITNYKIDFKEWLKNGDIVYTEVKGFETQLWKVKWELTKAIWPNIEGVEEHAQLLIVK